MSEPSKADLQSRSAYREWMVQTSYKVSESYDKAVMTLSGGAFAISMTFIHDIAPSPDPRTLLPLALAWASFGISIASILISKLTSQWAIAKAIQQFDAGTIDHQRPGRAYALATSILNIAAGGTFLTGAALLAGFAVANLRWTGHPVG